MDKFLLYTWYDIECLGHISIARNDSYKIDILVKKYIPADDHFVYSRLRDVVMSGRTYGTSGKPIVLQHKGGDLPEDVRPIAFMRISTTDNATVCPDIISVEAWRGGKNKKVDSSYCPMFDYGHNFNDAGKCSCGET